MARNFVPKGLKNYLRGAGSILEIAPARQKRLKLLVHRKFDDHLADDMVKVGKTLCISCNRLLATDIVAGEGKGFRLGYKRFVLPSGVVVWRKRKG